MGPGFFPFTARRHGIVVFLEFLGAGSLSAPMDASYSVRAIFNVGVTVLFHLFAVVQPILQASLEQPFPLSVSFFSFSVGLQLCQSVVL